MVVRSIRQDCRLFSLHRKRSVLHTSSRMYVIPVERMRWTLRQWKHPGDPADAIHITPPTPYSTASVRCTKRVINVGNLVSVHV